MKCYCRRLFTWFLSAGLVAAGLSQAARAVDVRVTVRNLAASDSVALSPIILGFHNGSVDLFDAAAAASAGIEDVAEMGSMGLTLQSEITAAQSSAVTLAGIATSGGFGPGILVPGAEASYVVTLDPTDNRYLSYASMVVPSNDAFIGNDDPTGIELFDAGGNFVGQDFTLTGANIWDAGTEVNSVTGAAYVVGQSAGDGTAEGGTVQLVTDLNAQFGIYSGESTPPGGTFNTIPSANADLVSFEFAVIPEPGTLLLLGIGSVSLLAGRRVR